MEKQNIINLIKAAVSKKYRADNNQYFAAAVAQKTAEKIDEAKKELAREMFADKKKV